MIEILNVRQLNVGYMINGYVRTVCNDENYDNVLKWISEGKEVLSLQTQVEIDSGIQQQINFDSLQYLNFTDWYITRSIETGVSVPSDVTEKRNIARLKIAHA